MRKSWLQLPESPNTWDMGSADVDVFHRRVILTDDAEVSGEDIGDSHFDTTCTEVKVVREDNYQVR